MPKQQSVHYHKYQLFKWPSGKTFYKCILPGCPHYLPLAHLTIGRESLCHGYMCNNLTVITREDVSRGVVYPMCSECKEKRKERREEMSKIS